MLKANTKIDCFLVDPYTNILEYEGETYQKVRYSDTLVILYKTNSEGLSLSNMNLEFLGVYSLTKEAFICVCPANCYKNIFLDNNEDYNDYSIYCLNEHLNELVLNELIEILDLQLKPNSNMSKEVIDAAKSLYLKKEEPNYSFDSFNEKLSFENLELFCSDEEDYAYNCAEKLFLTNPKIKEIYQHYLDVKTTLEYLKQDAPIDFELQQVINDLSTNKNYKTYNIVLTTDGVKEEQKTIEISSLIKYPLYAIKRVYWGRKLLFDIVDYDEVKIRQLRKDEKYNCEFIEKNNSYYDKDYYLNYVDSRMFNNHTFCQKLINSFGSSSYYRIDKAFKENIAFIKQHIDKVGFGTVIENVSSSFIRQNEDFFLSLIVPNKEYAFMSFPQEIRDEEKFAIQLIKTKGGYALNNINPSLFSNANIQKAFDEWFEENIVYPTKNFYCSEVSEFDLSQLTNQKTRLNAVSLSNISTLPKTDLDDEKFVYGFIDKLNSSGKVIQISFDILYNALDTLKTNKSIIFKILECCKIKATDWDILDDSLRQEKDIQKVVVNNNHELLYLMDRDIQEEYLLQDAVEFLKYTIKKSEKVSIYGRHFSRPSKPAIYDESLLELIVTSSLTNAKQLTSLEILKYSQSNDINLAKKLININPLAFKYFSIEIRNNEKIALMVLNKGVSVIPMLPEKQSYNNSSSLFNNEKIMRKSLEINPYDFQNIPEESRQTGPAPVLRNRDFVLYAVKLNSYNARFLPSKSKYEEDSEIALTAITDDIELAEIFVGKLFRDETFVENLLESILKKYKTKKCFDSIIEDTKHYIMNRIPKKIKGTTNFINKFPMFTTEGNETN